MGGTTGVSALERAKAREWRLNVCHVFLAAPPTSNFDGFEERPSSSDMTRHRYDNGPSKAFDDGRDRR
jgi:hypothetical protein